MAVGIWLVLAVFAAIMIFGSSHFLLAVTASHIDLPQWLFFVGLFLCYIIPVAIVLFAVVLMLKRKLPGL